MMDGKMGMVLPDDTPTTDGRIRVYIRNNGTWTNSRYPMGDLRWAVPGDVMLHDDGRRATYEANVNDPTFQARLEDGRQVTWERQYVTFAADATPKPPIENLTVTIGGVEYVRKDVVDKDIETLTTITHRKSVEHALCGVYDETQRQVDAATTYMKMGARYKDYDVSVEQTIVVRRTFRVERALNEEAAIETARRFARDYTLNTVSPRRSEETVSVVRSDYPTDSPATARAVN
jgi:hypothetical protein